MSATAGSGKPQRRLSVVGATTLAGRELLGILEARQFPFDELVPLGSGRAVGAEVEAGGRALRVGRLEAHCFVPGEVAFFAISAAVAAAHAPRAGEAGAVAIDLSRRFRLDPDVPLVVPEVNAEEAAKRPRGIVACPGPVAVALAVTLGPLARAAGLARVVVSTYQAASGAGRRGVARLARQSARLLSARGAGGRRDEQRVAFDCVPQIGPFGSGGGSSAEEAIVAETRRLLGMPRLPLAVTAVRVPVFFGYGISVHVETVRPLSAADARRILREAPGVLLAGAGVEPGQDVAAAETAYVSSLGAVGTDATHVGRVREVDPAGHGLALWVAIDNLRKGAALNAVQVAEVVLRSFGPCTSG